jgi:DNA-directed RNA polymerase specialized sigma24 family protein
MSFDANLENIKLLRNNPQQLILSIQNLVDIIIYQFIKAGKFNAKDKNDIKQQINEELLKKISRIQNQFQGKSLLKTYLATIVTNICHEILRKSKRIEYISFDETSATNRSEAIDHLVIKEEIKTFKNALHLYYKQKPKLILMLKLKFRIPFYFLDFKNFHSGITNKDFEEFTREIAPYEHSTDVKIFIALTKIFNKFENKQNTPDAIRKWIKQKINELIHIMNGDPPVSRHDEETIKILFENCFLEKKEMVSAHTLKSV